MRSRYTTLILHRLPATARPSQSLADLHEHGLIGEPPSIVEERIATVATLEEALAGASYAQESIRETLEAKRDIYSRMDTIAAPSTVLASSTSTIPASAFTEGLQHRERCLVVHPVNPPYLVPLVEICPAPWTTQEVLERTHFLQTRVGQVPILVRREIQGFILNRLQAALVNEALALFADGYASAEDIDKTVRDGLGLRWSFMGPFETCELNAPGGIVDYARRYGEVIYQQVQTQQPRKWEHPVVGLLEAERRQILPAEALAARQAWRDRRLMALLRHKKSAVRS